MGFGDPITIQLYPNTNPIECGEMAFVQDPAKGIKKKKPQNLIKQRGKVRAFHLSSTGNRTPASQNKICQVRDLTPTKREKYLQEILQLAKDNTFDPYTQATPSDDQKRNGFLSEAFEATELKLQQTYTTAFNLGISHAKTHPFFVAIDESKDQIIGIMPTPNPHGRLKRNLAQHQLTLPIVDLVGEMIKVLPDANPVNTWYTGGICIDKNYRGQGLARRLFENLITWLRTKDTRYLIISYDNENLASTRFCANFNNIPMGSGFEGFNMINRPYTIKVLDLNHEPLFKMTS